MTDDALAQAIAARDAAWRQYAKHRQEPTLRSIAEYHQYQRAVAELRAICPHERVEDRSYGAPVCCLCGESQ